MNNTALRAELLSTSGACLATTEAERRPQSATSHKESVVYNDHFYDITHMVFANEKHEKFYYEKLEQARYPGWQTSGSVNFLLQLCNVLLGGHQTSISGLLPETEACP